MENFDDIRCYTDTELQPVLQRIMAEDGFWRAAQAVCPGVARGDLEARLRQQRSIEEFQVAIFFPILRRLEQTLTDGISVSGLEQVSDKPHVYMSNHRDIILDSALLDKCLVENGRHTVEIAIGDNLLIYPWIEDLVRLNRSFIVRRGGSMREVLTRSVHLSEYIHHTMRTQGHSIWIAQREGRAKDSDDRTQDSVLKMLAISGPGDLADNLKEVDICPLAISYEYDPCDYLKARELQLRRDRPDWRKTREDDLLSMSTGVMGRKGRVSYRFCPGINDELQAMAAASADRHDLARRVARHIDRSIHASYEIYNVNRIAFDLLADRPAFDHLYQAEEKDAFLRYVDSQVDRIRLEHKDVPFLRRTLTEMYANPLRNQLAAQRPS